MSNKTMATGLSAADRRSTQVWRFKITREKIRLGQGGGSGQAAGEGGGSTTLNELGPGGNPQLRTVLKRSRARAGRGLGHPILLSGLKGSSRGQGLKLEGCFVCFVYCYFWYNREWYERSMNSGRPW